MDIFTLTKRMRLALVTLLLCACIHTLAIEREHEPLNNGFLSIKLKNVRDWSRSLGDRLVSVSKGLTYYHELNKTYQTLQSKDLHGDSLVEDIAKDFEVLLKSKLKAVMDLVTEAERVYLNYTFDEDLDVGYLNSKTVFSYDEQESTMLHFNGSTDPADETVREMAEFNDVIDFVTDKKFMKTPVNYNYSTVHVPTNVYDRSPTILNGAYWTRMLDEKFKENNERFKSLRWQYFCSSDGFFRVYPGLKWPRDNEKSGIDTYDCRVRSWYLQAATCPKNVLILLDTSGSMKGSRMVIARSTVKAILNTLDDDDYFNILRFSDTVEYIDPCFEGSMMQATEMNKRHLQELIDVNITARKGADFKHAFDTAFHLLNSQETHRRKSRLCNKAILLITDGVPEHYDEVFKHYTKNFTFIQTRVFTHLIGREVDDDREVRWMACANKGYYSHISTLADVQENVQNYIKVMSRPMVIKRFHNKIWTSIYLDHMSHLDRNEGLQFMTSVAIPVFDTKNETFNDGNLLGVMGTDVPVASLKELVPIHQLGANGFAFLINHNGYVLMHPDYTPFRHPSATQSVLNPYYNNIDLNDVTQTSEQFKDLRKRILSENNNFGSAEVELRRFYDKARRMSKRTYHIFYSKVVGTDFSIGIALPATSMSQTATASYVPSLLECLNETNVEIAPWLYCSDLDPKLTGKERIRALLQIFKADPDNCKRELLDFLTVDAQNLKDASLDQKWLQSTRFSSRKHCRKVNGKVVAEHFASNNISLLFIGTRNGLTRYMSANDSYVPYFIRNNTDTLNADYYKRAVEAIEDMVAGKPRYSFTYSVSLDEEFNVNTSLVTASAPIYEGMNDNRRFVGRHPPFVYAVVGLQMEYKKFEDIFMSTTTSELSRTRCDDISLCSCKEHRGNCYIVDNHGYVVASKVPDYQVGLFFGDIPDENKVMSYLVQSGVFIRDEFTDYQALCEKDSDDEAGSAAPNLLNPIKAFLSGMLWTITELLLFISEFSFKSLWFSFGTTHSAAANGQTQAQCESLPYDSLGPMEKVAYSQACPSQVNEEDTKTYDPCHKTFTLYRVNFTRLPFEGEVPGIFTDESRVNEGMERAPVIRRCKKPFAVTWVEDTNLVLIVTSRLCEADDPSSLVDFQLAHRKKNYSTDQMCRTRERREIYVNYMSQCIYDRYDNETRTCGVAKQVISTKVLLISFVISFTHIFVHCLL